MFFGFYQFLCTKRSKMGPKNSTLCLAGGLHLPWPPSPPPAGRCPCIPPGPMRPLDPSILVSTPPALFPIAMPEYKIKHQLHSQAREKRRKGGSEWCMSSNVCSLRRQFDGKFWNKAVISLMFSQHVVYCHFYYAGFPPLYCMGAGGKSS